MVNNVWTSCDNWRSTTYTHAAHKPDYILSLGVPEEIYTRNSSSALNMIQSNLSIWSPLLSSHLYLKVIFVLSYKTSYFKGQMSNEAICSCPKGDLLLQVWLYMYLRFFIPIKRPRWNIQILLIIIRVVFKEYNFPLNVFQETDSLFETSGW